MNCDNRQAKLGPIKEESKVYTCDFKTIDMINFSDLNNPQYLLQTKCSHSSHLVKIESIKDESIKSLSSAKKECLYKTKGEFYSPEKIRKLLLERKMPKESLWRNTLVNGIPAEW
eukprot:TRINITY_DN7612_c0_g1_i3.p2 TRINITY_DN7612_c0_g1~~TRINITY_DN7612_c0_g1_i3.p2  ORF type:complete len:115 (-),score=30.68 TRINITY_DN7612_c0_g1_i3:865-1209(-)